MAERIDLIGLDKNVTSYPLVERWTVQAIELDREIRLEEIAGRLQGLNHLAFLDSSRNDIDSGRYSYLTAEPFQIMRSRGWRVELKDAQDHCLLTGNPWRLLQGLLRQHRLSRIPNLPSFQTGAIGYFGYDLGRRLEKLPSLAVDDLGLPEIDVGFYDWVLATDHQASRNWLIVSGPADQVIEKSQARLDWLLRRINHPRLSVHAQVPTELIFLSNFTREEYLRAVQQAQRYITAGDIYQVCLSQRLSANFADDDGWTLYQILRQQSPVPHGAYLNFGEAEIMSISPERFLRLDGHRVETRPIKGTRARGYNQQEDLQMAQQLVSSEKDLAENVMIVDLLRNDIGRVCQIGSVQVPRLAALEAHPNVWHLVSTICGDLPPTKDAVDLLVACFPGGSVTGCPKIRAMEIIEELEPVRRGIYCGAIGYLAFDGDMDTSIVIRTLIKTDDRLHLQVGGAVLADSDPETEYIETLTKAGSVLKPLGANLVEQ